MTLELPIYLDNNATTPTDPRVVEAMSPYFSKIFGNPASQHHSFGWRAEEAVEQSREKVAGLIGARPREIVFTSGATESDNLAIKGVVEKYADRGNHVITCRTEHKAVIDTCKYLEKHGCDVTYLDVDAHGQIAPEQIDEAITDRTVLITIMAANNETGVLHRIPEIGRLSKERGILFHSDATQAVGKLPVDVGAMGVDLLSLSGHKMYGPKGVGALYVRKRSPRVRLSEQMHGGGHERASRSGTLNVPGIVGLGEACRLAGEQQAEESARIARMRNELERRIVERLPYVRRNGHPTQRLPNTLNLSFAYVEGEAIMLRLKDVAVSSGSACSSATLEPSYVLRAMGVGDALAHSSLRFSFGRFNDDGDAEYAADRVVAAVEGLREMSPLFDQAISSGDADRETWIGPDDLTAADERPPDWPGETKEENITSVT